MTKATVVHHNFPKILKIFLIRRRRKPLCKLRYLAAKERLFSKAQQGLLELSTTVHARLHAIYKAYSQIIVCSMHKSNCLMPFVTSHTNTIYINAPQKCGLAPPEQGYYEQVPHPAAQLAQLQPLVQAGTVTEGEKGHPAVEKGRCC